MQTTKERCIETIPVGPLGLIALDSHKELGKKVNDYLVSWRQERNLSLIHISEPTRP